MSFLRRIGLAGRLAAILLFVVVIDLVVNSIVFDRVNGIALNEGDARRIADQLVIAHRVLDATPLPERGTMAGRLSTDRMAISWAARAARPASRIELLALRQQLLAFAPQLRRVDVQLHVQPVPRSGAGEIGGSLVLPDQSVVMFRTHGRVSWVLGVKRFVGLALPSFLLVLLAWVLFRVSLNPLRSLVRATSQVGTADPQPLAESGTGEVYHLIRAFNHMQERIHQLLASGSQTLLAIGHDLRIPLARLQLRLDNAPIAPDLRSEMARDIAEMRDLLQSLQTYVESGKDNMPAERIDVAAMVETQVENACDMGASAVYVGPDSLEIMARPLWIRRAISNLIENALRYAGSVCVEVRRVGGVVEIEVSDNGPGIPENRLEEVLLPFIRLDNARSRDTPGMGLGLPIVDRAVKAEDGELVLANQPSGGLRVTIRLPHALN